jgi:hypothetical protein
MDEMTPIEEFEAEQAQRPQKVFALVTDNEVFHKWYVDEDYSDPGMASLIYGLQSQPVIIDITDKNHEDITLGWTVDGDNFIPPKDLDLE